MGKTVGRTVLMLVALGAVWTPAVTQAAEDSESLIRQGNDLRRRGDNVRANGYFKRAYDISKTPRSAAQLGISFYALGQFAQADALLSEALGADDPWVDSQRAVLETTRKSARKHLGVIAIVGAPKDATVSGTGRTASKLDPSGVVVVKPGENTLRIETSDHEPMTKTVTVAAGETVTLKFDAPALPVAAAPVVRPRPTAMETSTTTAPIPLRTSPPVTVEENHPGRAGRVTGIVLVGLGAATGVAGILMRNIASTKLANINNEAATGMRFDEKNGNWKTYDTMGIGLMAAGAASVVAGAIVFIVNWPRSQGAASEQVSFGLMPNAAGGATIQIGGRF